MKLRSAIVYAALLAGSLGTANAQTRGVVELFTSQGCSSCPPADKLLGALASDPSLVALSFPVDYWDYIGWKDTFASPAYTSRQHAYATARGDDQVYTPQAVVDGLTHTVGSDQSALMAALRSSAGKSGAMCVPVSLTGTSSIKVDIGTATCATPAAADVWLLRIAHKRIVKIGRGENSGASVTYTNVVREMKKLGSWTGSNASFAATGTIEQAGDGYAVLVQATTHGRPGAVLGAGKTPGL